MTVPASGPTTFYGIGPGIGASTIDGASPQHSYAGIYTPLIALSDRVGFSAGTGPVSARVAITFSSPISNPIIHIANLDRSFLDFSPSISLGLTSMTLITGNGGGMDGLALSAPIIFDAMPTTFDTTPVASPPPIAGPRSGYGSVLLLGTFSSMAFDIVRPSGIENASITISAIPKPSSLFLCITATLALIRCRTQRPPLRTNQN